MFFEKKFVNKRKITYWQNGFTKKRFGNTAWHVKYDPTNEETALNCTALHCSPGWQKGSFSYLCEYVLCTLCSIAHATHLAERLRSNFFVVFVCRGRLIFIYAIYLPIIGWLCKPPCSICSYASVRAAAHTKIISWEEIILCSTWNMLQEEKRPKIKMCCGCSQVLLFCHVVKT